MKAENTLWMGDIEPLMTESTIINSFQYFNFYPEAVKLIKDKINKKNKQYRFQTWEITGKNSNIHIVVPRYKIMMTHCAKQRP